MDNPNNSTKNLLAISAIGTYRPGLFGKITQSFIKCGCEIVESRFSVMGDKLQMMAMISGNWDAIAKIETAIDRLGTQIELDFTTRRSSDKPSGRRLIPYVMEVVSIQNNNLVHEAIRFFELQKIDIEEVHFGCYTASHTKSHMASLQITVSVPQELSISSFRSDFVDFCDRLNIDAVLEPVK